MIKIADLFKSEGWKSKLLLQVHDELVFEVPDDELGKATEGIRSVMENALPLDVPVKVDIGIGKNWLDAK
jgi:DNA polymerase-1